jgi:intergrase/recombinase
VLTQRIDNRENKNFEGFDWNAFREWLLKRYSKTWAPTVFSYAKKYHWMLAGNLRELDSFSKSKKNNVLKSLIALSKYLGVYQSFKLRVASYGIKWEYQDSLEAFLRITEPKEEIVEWLKACLKVLDEDKSTFLTFLAISGLRKGEAINSFNLIIKLSQKGKLNKYYNKELQSLEHFRFGKLFLRGSKNVFFSFIPSQLIDKIAKCKSISETTLKRHLKRNGLKSRLNELRDYFATFMVYNGLIREEADLLQGRIGKSIFMRHYFSPAIKDLRDRTLKAINKMMRVLSYKRNRSG